MVPRVLRQLGRSVSGRIALWHGAIFLVGSLLVFGSAHVLLSRSLDEQTQDVIEFRLNQFAAEYARGGTEGVVEICKLRRGRAQKAFFVRLADSANRTIFLRDPEDWVEFGGGVTGHGFPAHPAREVKGGWTDLTGSEGSHLRLASTAVGEGMVLQVGRTLDAADDLLVRFQHAFLIVGSAVVMAGVGGTASASFRALRPVRQLTEAVRVILVTDRFTARVSSRGTGSEIDDLVKSVNTMLDRIERLVRGMRESLDNVAHDLRTPVTRLRNVAQHAIETDADKSASHEALGDCLEESERVMTMLVTLMDIAEAETGVMKLECRNVSIEHLAGRVMELYELVAEEREIALRCTIPPGLSVHGDAVRLQRVLANLVDNALKYTAAGGEVRIGAAALEEEKAVVITVRDNGEGIAAEELERIWERLYRVDRSRSRRGLGLGLSFVRAIVEAHGGTIEVTSEPGKGSCFSVRLAMR